MSRRLALGAVAMAAALCAAALPSGPATAAPVPTGAAAGSTGIVITPGTGLSASLTLNGAVGVLLGPLVNPILSTASSTLLTALLGDSTATPPVPGLVPNLVSALTALTGTSAGTPSTQVTNPAPGFPSCAAAGWSSSTCYSLTSLASTGAAASLVTLAIPTVRGYTDADPDATNNQPMTARAQVANPALTVLGQNIGTLGVVDSTSTCPTSSSSQSSSAASLGTTSTLTGASLLGGLVTAGLAGPNGVLQVGVNGAPAVSVNSLAIQTLTPVGGLPITVGPAGNNGLGLTVRLDLGALLNGLGLGLISGLTGLSGGSINLSVVLAPGGRSVSTTNGSATASGLEVKVGLSGTLGLSVLGLVGANLTIGSASGSSQADLLDLQLARTSCTGSATSSGGPPWFPPGLI